MEPMIDFSVFHPKELRQQREEDDKMPVPVPDISAGSR